MNEIETSEIEQALKHERKLEPSNFGTVALSLDVLVAGVGKLDGYVTEQLKVTPVVQQGFDSMGNYITKEW